jgi:hypothetical protein
MLGLEGRIGTVAPGMIADLIVVNGDPVADITVLQQRERIETVIKDGRIVEFDEEAIARSWPHDRGIGYSVIDLTYDVVHGADPRERQAGEKYTFDGEHARDLVADLRRRERAAGSTESV